MKIAYLTSKYPAVSHTFILREVAALRARGVDVGTFSIRAATDADVRGEEAARERDATRALVPIPWGEVAGALVWALTTRPGAACSVLFRYATGGGMGLRERFKWLAYGVEGILLARWLRQRGVQHLHCHFGNSGSNAGMFAAEVAGIPFSITCHGSELNDPHGFRLPDKVANAAFIACVSKFGRARLMHVCEPDDWRKLHIVRCGLAPGTPDPYPAADDGQHIVCVARLSAEKAHLVLLEAFKQVLEARPSVKLTLVGDGPMRAAVESRITDLAIQESAVLTGSLEPARVAEFYKACHVVVLASFSEGVPVTLMEAFAHGRPVVATRVGGVPELVEDGASGYVVAPGDVAELRDALLSVLEDPQRAREMGEVGAKRVADEFNEVRSAEELERLFSDAVTRGAH